jgi:hypothetical protein
MRQIIALVIISAFMCEIAFGKIFIRTKRQVEREGEPTPNYRNESTVIANGDREPIDLGTPETNNGDTDVMEVDFDKDDGSFSFGGRFPLFLSTNFHNNFDSLFRQMTRRFEEMAKSMFERFNTTSSQYPPNYNGTKEEIIEVDGKKYIKKERVVKKSGDNLNIFITSTTYEPVDDQNNES